MMAGWQSDVGETIKRGILAGTAGGLAEIVWLVLYAGVTGGNAASLARGVTTAAGMTALLPAASGSLGIAIHMTLAVFLGMSLAGLWQGLARHTQRLSTLYGVMLTALAAIWATNFLVILPAISPSFVNLVPLPVSLMSKLLFGLAAAETLRRCAVARVAVMQRA